MTSIITGFAIIGMAVSALGMGFLVANLVQKRPQKLSSLISRLQRQQWLNDYLNSSSAKARIAESQRRLAARGVKAGR